MRIVELQQGSDEWKQFRAKHFPASEAPVMMGVSPKMTRAELLRLRATGNEKEFSDYVQKYVLDRGHELEAAARPIAEQIIGEELFPVTCVDDDGFMSASTDGMTLDGTIGWEHKSMNEELRRTLETGEIPPPTEHWWQVQQQLYVTGAEKWLFMASNGTEDDCSHIWVYPDAGAFDMLKRRWEQFAEDLRNYTPAESVEPEVVGRSPDQLPALRIQVTGAVTDSNLGEFKQTALSVLESINTNLQTDQDFADAEKAVKFCKTAEQRLDAAKDHALSQTASIDELFRAIDDIKETARQKRLELEKLVKQRKQAVRDEILLEGQNALREHIESLNKRLGVVRMPEYHADFAGAMKGKKKLQSLRDAVDDELSKAKIALNEHADEAQRNIALLEQYADVKHLFPDLQQIAFKAHDDFSALVTARRAQHESEEKERLEAERERIRREEERKAQQRQATEQREAVNQVSRECAESSSVVRKGSDPDNVAELPNNPQQPTASEIIDVIADHYGVDVATAEKWLANIAQEGFEYALPF